MKTISSEFARPEVSEVVAAAVHETWMRSRLAQGWTYGPERNDALRTNPCIVPYEELPEVEKAYDRETAKTVIRMLKSLGFEINWRRER